MGISSLSHAGLMEAVVKTGVRSDRGEPMCPPICFLYALGFAPPHLPAQRPRTTTTPAQSGTDSVESPSAAYAAPGNKPASRTVAAERLASAARSTGRLIHRS